MPKVINQNNLIMNKKPNSDDVLSKRTTIRYKFSEYQIVLGKAKKASLSFSEFCRQITIEGYVQATNTAFNMNEIRELKNLLIEYRTNFSRISNLIKSSDPNLNAEIVKLKNSIQNVIDKTKV